ncbi:MAG: ATP-binding protein [Thermodesulfobacteriota bacterium]
MIDPDFDIIFEDIVEVDEAPRNFLEILEDLLPEAFFLMILAKGTVLEGGRQVNLSIPERQELAGLTRKNGSCFRRWPDEGRDCYGTWLAGYEAVLLTVIKNNESGGEFAEIGGLLYNTIEMALLKQHCELLVVEKEQARKQIEILKNQHGRLIEDNYRQYRLNQEREKQYTRKLETEIARQTAELRETNRRLEEISRLKSDFLANITHELRTPMNAIIGFAELLKETGLDKEQTEYTRTITQSARSLLALINDILDLVKVEAGKLELEKIPFGLPELISNVADMFRVEAREKGLDIRCKVGDRVPERVLGGFNRLRQVLVNLTGNAIKFTEKGYVALQIDYAGEREGRSLVRFMVVDTGLGIARDRIYDVFDKFTQADSSTTREYGGTGLGLSICQQLVDLMGGNIFVSSEPGKGSIFCFVIPFESAGSEERRGVMPEIEIQQEQTGPGGRVLIVEDNAVNQRLARIIVEGLGYEVEVAADGLEALDILKQQVFDIVFMDAHMPNMDGREATKRIRSIEADPDRRKEFVGLRSRNYPLQVIGLSALARKEDEHACYEAGMDAFLSKPLVKKELIRFLRGLNPAPK